MGNEKGEEVDNFDADNGGQNNETTTSSKEEDGVIYLSWPDIRSDCLSLDYSDHHLH